MGFYFAIYKKIIWNKIPATDSWRWNEKMETFAEGFVLIKDSKIIEIGSMKKYNEDYKKLDAIEVIDAKEKIVIPGFVNAHNHFAMTLFRGIADDLPLKEWLSNYIWPLEANLLAEDCYIGTMLALLLGGIAFRLLTI